MKSESIEELDVVEEFKSLLETDFEKEFYDSILESYSSNNNILKFHQFACSIRELLRNILARKSPDDEVVRSDWYQSQDREKGLDRVTRRERVKYVIQKKIPNEYIEKTTLIVDNTVKEYVKEIDKLSKYTHINEGYFSKNPDDIVLDMRRVLSVAIEALSLINEIEADIPYLFEDDIYKTNLVNCIPGSIDILAERVFIDEYEIEDIECVNIDDNYIYMKVHGNVSVDQEYGPKDDLCNIPMCYPFSQEFKINMNDFRKITFDLEDMEIDTSSWYGDD